MSEVTFIGEPIYTSSKREYYTAFKNAEGSDAQFFEVGSFVSLLPSEEEPERRFVCIIERIWKALRKSTDESGFVEKKNQAYVRVRWFYFTEDHPQLANHSRNEVFYSFHNDTNSCLSVVSPVSVTFLRDWDVMPQGFGDNNYFCKQVFDSATIRGSSEDEDRVLLITDISNQKDSKKDSTKDWKKDWKNEIEGIKSIINRKGEPIKLWGLGGPKEDGCVALKKTPIRLIWEQLPKTSATIIYQSCFAFHMFKPNRKQLKKRNTNDFIDSIGNPDDVISNQEVLENNDNHPFNNKNHKNNKIIKKVSSPKQKSITKPKSLKSPKSPKSPKLSPKQSPKIKPLEIVLKEKKIPKKSKNIEENAIKKEKKEEKVKKRNIKSKIDKVDSESESKSESENKSESDGEKNLYDRVKERPIASFKLKKPLSLTYSSAPPQEKKLKTKESPVTNTTITTTTTTTTSTTNKPTHRTKTEKNQFESTTKHTQSTSSSIAPHPFSKTTPSHPFVSLHFPSVVSIDSTRDPRLKQSNDLLLPTPKLPTSTSLNSTSTFNSPPRPHSPPHSPPYVPSQVESEDDYFFDFNNRDENTNTKTTTTTYENESENNNNNDNDNEYNDNDDNADNDDNNSNNNNDNDTNSNNPFSNIPIFSQVAAFAASLPKSNSVNSVESPMDNSVDTSIPPKTEIQYEYEPCLTPLPSPKIQVKPLFEVPHITLGLMGSPKDVLADIFSPEIYSCNVPITLKNVTLNDFPIQFPDLDEKKKKERKSERNESSEDDSYIDDRSKRRKSDVEASESKKGDSKVDELKVITTTKSNELKLSESKLSETKVSEVKVSERKETTATTTTTTKSSEVQQSDNKEVTANHVNQTKPISLDLQTIPLPPSIFSIPSIPPPPSISPIPPPPVNLPLSSNVRFPLQVFPMPFAQPHIMQPNVIPPPNTTVQSNVIPIPPPNIPQPVQQSVVQHNLMLATAFNFLSPSFHITQNDIDFFQSITLNRNFLQYLFSKPNFGAMIRMFLIRVSIQGKPMGTQVALGQIYDVVDDVMSPYMLGDRITRRGLKVRLDGSVRTLKLENISNQSPQPTEIANFCSEVFPNRTEFPPQSMIDAIAAEKRAFSQTKV